jgi:phage terminase small subunit
MGALKNTKHEKFAQGIAKGMSQDAAYEAAGYKQHRGNASTLRSKQNVIDRIAELAEGAAKRSAKSLDDVIAAYERIAFFQLSDFITIDEDSNPKYDLRGRSNMNELKMSSYAPTPLQ